MSGPAILIGPLNGAIIAYVISTWLFDFRPGSGEEWGVVGLGAFIGLMVVLSWAREDAQRR